MKKLCKSLLICSVFCLTTAGCGTQPTPDPKPILLDKVELFYAYSHENLQADINYLDKDSSDTTYIDRDYTLRYDCLRNEFEGMQLIMHAIDHVASFDFSLKDDLKSESGNILGKENFEVLAEYYQYISASNEKAWGYFPDALIPLSNYKFRMKDYIDAGHNQGIYLNLFVPKDTVSDLYVGEGLLTVDGKDYDIPIEVNVRKDTLTDDNHLNRCILIWYDQIPLGEKENTSTELEQKYYDTVVTKRLSPDSLPPSKEVTPEIFANAFVEIAKNNKIASYRFPVEAGNYSKKRVEDYMQALVDKNLELRRQGDTTTDLFKKLLFYVDDEPSSSLEVRQRVRAHDKEMYEIKKDKAEQLNAYPDLKNSLLHINNLVTTPFTEDLIATEEVGGVQTWAPQFDNFQTEEQRAVYKARQQSTDRSCGENVWWYGCISPKGNYPSFHLNAPTLYARTIPYMEYNYGIEGMVYWNVCYYSKYDKGLAVPRDIWSDPITWENCAGDGLLFYPGYEYNIDHPITTLRMENILAGNEEYEYLYALNGYVDKYNRAFSQNKNLNEMLKKEYAKLFKGVQPIRKTYSDQVNIINLKTILLNALDKFTVSLIDGINYLEGLGK